MLNLLSILSSLAVIFMLSLSLRSFNHYKRYRARDEERTEEIHRYNMEAAQIDRQMRLTQLKIVEAELTKVTKGTVGFTKGGEADHGG